MSETEGAKKPAGDFDPENVDEYEHYNYDHDKHMYSGHSGKGRTKKEASQHTNHPDPGGHTRKTTQKLMNSHEKEKEAHKPKTDAKHCKH